MQPTSDDPRRPASEPPSHLYPGTAPDHDGAGRHVESDSSIAVADLIASIQDDHTADATTQTANGNNGRSGADGATGQAAPAQGAPEQSGQDGNKWITLVAVCLGTFMLLLDVTIVNVALPDIQTALSSSFADLQWVVDAYALTLAALLLTAGSLADMYGRRKLYVVGLTVFTIASLLCGVAQSTLMLQLSRGLQGIGGAIMFSVSLALLATAFRGKDRGAAFGIWGAITGLAVAIGPLLGGILTSGLSWRWIFFVNLPLGVIAVILTLAKVTESRLPHGRRPDWIGFALFSVGLAALIYGLIESNEESFSDIRVIVAFIVAFVLIVGFLIAEWKLPTPMFELSLFRKPTFSGGAVAAFGLSASIFAMLLYLVLYVQDILGYSPFQTGVRLLLASAGILLTSTAAGRLTSRVPVRYLIGPGLLLVGAGLLLMRGLDASTDWTHLIAGLIVSGAGVGLVNPPLASTAIGVVTPDRAGMASGINSTFRQVGIATGIALLGTLFASRVNNSVHDLLAGTPFASRASQLSTAVQSGASNQVVSKLKAQHQDKLASTVHQVATGAFADGLDFILLVGAIIALAAGVIALATIRQKDFAHQGG